MTERASEMIAMRRAAAVEAAWARVLSEEAGRLVVWSILDRCLLFQQTHYGNDLDGLRAGMREVGLQILQGHVLPHDPRTFASMQVEHTELMDRIQQQVDLETEKDNEDE